MQCRRIKVKVVVAMQGLNIILAPDYGKLHDINLTSMGVYNIAYLSR